MHQPTATAHPSLYYDYRVHPYVPPPERLGQGTRQNIPEAAKWLQRDYDNNRAVLTELGMLE